MLGLLVVALATGSVPAASLSGITSTYTRLNLDRCKQLDNGEYDTFASWRCPGYRGVALYVQMGDERFDVDAGSEDADEHWSNQFDSPPETVEWRIRNGRPFAIIYRLTTSGEGPRTSTLMVETIGGTKPGCRVAAIPGNVPAANERAREAADFILAGRATCLKNE